MEFSLKMNILRFYIMKWVFLFIMVILYHGTVLAKDIETNDINSPTATVNLDSNLRRALLKALTELENEELEKMSSLKSDNRNSPPVVQNEGSSKSYERASATAVSIVTNSKHMNDNRIISTKSTISVPTFKPIVVVQESRGLQQIPIETFVQSKEDRELFLLSSNKFHDSKDEAIHTRSVHSNANSNSPNLVHSHEKSMKIDIHLSNENKLATTTPLPTPVTEEHESKVEDVQFFPAPLVVAFTVHQDASGLPNKVEPIYKPLVKNTLAPTSMEIIALASAPSTNNRNKNGLEHELFLQEKQNTLEHHIYNLRQQQLKQHEYLVRQQRIIEEQEERLNNQQLHSEQIKLNQQQSFLSHQQHIPLNLKNNKLNHNVLKSEKNQGNTLVTLQQSLPLNLSQQQLLQAGILPRNAQLLPVKNAVDFLVSPYNPNTLNKFHDISSQYHTQQNSNNFQLFSKNFVHALPSVQSYSVFRHQNDDSHLRNNENLRPNNNLNHFVPSHLNPMLQQVNRVFRSNTEGVHTSSFHHQEPYFVNQQLNNLLYQSGISKDVHQTEDLGIVSKILSYNLGRDSLARADV